MSPTFKKILIGLVILLIIALLWAFWFLRGSGMKQGAAPTPAQTQSSTIPPAELTIPLAPVSQEQVTVEKNRNMSTFAMQFAERYGSYSSDGNFQNYKDLTPVMSDAMWGRTEAVINAGMPAGEFYGVTTKALVIKIEAPGENSSRVLISTRRTETKGSSPSRAFNQDIRLELLKNDGEWKVDSAEWLPLSP